MSDYHAIDVSRKRDRITVAFHFPVPDENNAAGKPLSACLVERRTRDGGVITEVPAHATDHSAENAALVAGTVCEYVEVVRVDASLTNPQKLAVIEVRHTVLAARVPDWLREELRFWTYSGNVT